MYYYSVLLLLTRCEEEKKFRIRADGGLNRNQLCVGQPASECGAVGPISISWTLEAVKLFSCIQIFFLCACEKTYFFLGGDRKISATTPNVWRLLLWNIQKRVFRFVFIYFFVGSVIFSSSSSSCCYPRPWSLLSISSNVWRAPVKPLWLESRVQQLIGTFAQVPNREVAGVGVSLNR